MTQKELEQEIKRKEDEIKALLETERLGLRLRETD